VNYMDNLELVDIGALALLFLTAYGLVSLVFDVLLWVTT